jgi:curved DNA-binding protein CbpA
MPDLYAILGTERDASLEEIERAFRTKAKALHPDAGGSEEDFKALSQAIRVLRDPGKRAHYDRFGESQDGATAGDPAVQLVRHEVEALITAYLSKDNGALAHTDVVALMVSVFDQQITALEQQIEQIKQDTIKLSDFASRFEAKADNVIRRGIEYKLRNMVQTTENAGKQIEIRRRAREIAASHTFRADPQQTTVTAHVWFQVA